MMTIINTSEIGDATFWINILLCIFHQSNYVYPKNSLHQHLKSISIWAPNTYNMSAIDEIHSLQP